MHDIWSTPTLMSTGRIRSCCFQYLDCTCCLRVESRPKFLKRTFSIKITSPSASFRLTAIQKVLLCTRAAVLTSLSSIQKPPRPRKRRNWFWRAWFLQIHYRSGGFTYVTHELNVVANTTWATTRTSQLRMWSHWMSFLWKLDCLVHCRRL